MENTKKAIIYTRVSTTEQADKGYSLRDQKDRLFKYCDLIDIKVAAHFEEDFSAKTFKRPEFTKLLAYIKKHKSDSFTLFFIKWDRFSRNITETYIMLRTLERLGVNVVAIEQRLDMSIPESKSMHALYISAPEVENERRSNNTRDGMRRATKEGRWQRRALLGYTNARDKKNKPIIIHSPVAPIIKSLFIEYSKGQKTVEDIRRMARQKGVTICRSNMPKILQNQAYIGKVFLKALGDEAAQWLPGLHEPIIDEATFYKVQDIINQNRIRKVGQRNRMKNDKFPLRGNIICSNCGQKLTGSTSKGNGGHYRYYHCHWCGVDRIRVEDVDKAIAMFLASIKPNKGVVQLYNEILKDLKGKDGKEQKSIHRSLLTKKSKLNQRLENLHDLLIDGKIDAEDYQSTKSRYKSAINDIDSEIKDLKRQDRGMADKLHKTFSIIENLDKLYEISSLDQKNVIIGSIFPRKIEICDKKVRTNNINEVIALICKNNKELRNKKSGKNIKINVLSTLVAPTRIELVSKV